MLYAQAVMVLLGVVIVVRGRFHLGWRTVSAPIAPVVGWSLMAPIPLGCVLGVLFGVSEALGGRFGGETPSLEEVEMKYAWIDPSVTAVMALIAVVLTVIGLQGGATPAVDAPPVAADAIGPPPPTGPERPSDAITDRPSSDPHGLTTRRG
jgi:hypothetical protein